MQKFFIQINTDNHGFVNYCAGLSMSSRAYSSKKEAGTAMGKIQLATKGKHFQYRVSEQTVSKA